MKENEGNDQNLWGCGVAVQYYKGIIVWDFSRIGINFKETKFIHSVRTLLFPRNSNTNEYKRYESGISDYILLLDYAK